jgi:hypothetical protein
MRTGQFLLVGCPTRPKPLRREFPQHRGDFLSAPALLIASIQAAETSARSSTRPAKTLHRSRQSSHAGRCVPMSLQADQRRTPLDTEPGAGPPFPIWRSAPPTRRCAMRRLRLRVPIMATGALAGAAMATATGAATLAMAARGLSSAFAGGGTQPLASLRRTVDREMRRRFAIALTFSDVGMGVMGVGRVVTSPSAMCAGQSFNPSASESLPRSR